MVLDIPHRHSAGVSGLVVHAHPDRTGRRWPIALPGCGVKAPARPPGHYGSRRDPTSQVHGLGRAPPPGVAARLGGRLAPPRSPGTRSSRAARPRFRASLGAGPAGDHQPRSSSPVRHRTCSNNPSRAPLRRTWATTSRPSARALSSSSLTVISVSPSSGSGLHKPLNGLRRARAGSAGRNLWLDLSAARLRVGTAPVDWSRADGRRGAGACPTGRPRTSGSPVGQAGGALPNRRQAPAPREHPATIRDRIVNRPWRTPRPSPGTGHLPKDTHQRPARQDGRGGRRHRQHDLAGDRIEQMPSSSPRSSRRTHTPHHPPEIEQPPTDLAAPCARDQREHTVYAAEPKLSDSLRRSTTRGVCPAERICGADLFPCRSAGVRAGSNGSSSRSPCRAGPELVRGLVAGDSSCLVSGR